MLPLPGGTLAACSCRGTTFDSPQLDTLYNSRCSTNCLIPWRALVPTLWLGSLYHSCWAVLVAVSSRNAQLVVPCLLTLPCTSRGSEALSHAPWLPGPHLLLLLLPQVTCCFAQSVAATRWAIQDELRLQTTPCDNCIIGTSKCGERYSVTQHLCQLTVRWHALDSCAGTPCTAPLKSCVVLNPTSKQPAWLDRRCVPKHGGCGSIRPLLAGTFVGMQWCGSVWSVQCCPCY